MSAAQDIAAAVASICDVDNAIAYRPTRLSSSLAFVEPGEPWKERDDTYCATSIGLVVNLVAGITDPLESVEWLDAQSTLLMAADPIDVGADVVAATTVGPPFLFTDIGGGEFLACRVQYSRFTIGD